MRRHYNLAAASSCCLLTSRCWLLRFHPTPPTHSLSQSVRPSTTLLSFLLRIPRIGTCQSEHRRRRPKQPSWLRKWQFPSVTCAAINDLIAACVRPSKWYGGDFRYCGAGSGTFMGIGRGEEGKKEGRVVFPILRNCRSRLQLQDREGRTRALDIDFGRRLEAAPKGREGRQRSSRLRHEDDKGQLSPSPK